MQTIPPMVVFCDLDDTLFERRAFPLGAAARLALQRIDRDHVALVFCSGRTRAELELIQEELGISQPFICENGAATFVPKGYFGFGVTQAVNVGGYEVAEFGKPYAEVVTSLRHAANRLRIEVTGFSDMSVEEVAADFELSLLQARLAKLREYSEPFRIEDSRPNAVPRLLRALRGAGLDCAARGRYHHAGAIGIERGGRFLSDMYRRAWGKLLTVAFGDHPSAAPLLKYADIPIIVRSETSNGAGQLAADVPAAQLVVAASIESWAELVIRLEAAHHQRTGSRSS